VYFLRSREFVGLFVYSFVMLVAVIVQMHRRYDMKLLNGYLVYKYINNLTSSLYDIWVIGLSVHVTTHRLKSEDSMHDAAD